jgi:hypothetical protein
MALTPGLYVPQGQVGTGAAYVHEIDNSKYLEQLAYQNKQKRIDALKKQGEIQKSIEDIDYTKPSDPVMANQLLEEAKGIRDYFSNAYVQNKVNISDKTSEAGRRFEYAQDQLEANANRAAYAEKLKDKFDASIGAKPLGTYRSDLVELAKRKWDAAKTIDEKYNALALMDLDKLQNVDAYKFFNDAAKSIEEDKDFVAQIKDGGVQVDQFKTLLQQKVDEKMTQLPTSPEWDYMEADWEAKKSAMVNGKPKYPEYQTATFEEFAKKQMDSHAKTLESTYEQTHKSMNINVNTGGGGNNESLYTTYVPYDMPKKNPVPHEVADTGQVEGDNLVIQYGDNVSDFTSTGLENTLSSYYDSTTKKLKVPLSRLYLFPAEGQGKTLPVKKRDKATGSEVNVVGTFFTIDGSEAKDKKPTMIMKDRWGNVWVQLEGESEYVPIEAGGKVYTSNKGQVSKFQSAAQRNRAALKSALGKDWVNTYEEFGFGSDASEDAQ